VAYPERRLLTGEEIVFDVHPHLRTVAGPLLAGLLLAAGTVAGCWLLWDRPIALPMAIAGSVLVLLALTGPLLRRRATSLTVTTHRLILRRGVLSRTHRDLPLDRIDEIAIERRLAERLFGTGTLLVQPSGDRDALVIPDVPRILRVHRALDNLIDWDDYLAEDDRLAEDDQATQDEPPYRTVETVERRSR
jgi:uncharacterized membrane protein YdbT with pleckstrin-like domain